MPINNFLGETYLLAGDFGASQRAFERGMAMDPNFPLPHAYIAGLFEVTRKYETAIVPCVPGIPRLQKMFLGDLFLGGGCRSVRRSLHAINSFHSKRAKQMWRSSAIRALCRWARRDE